jgi:hypothetical protein
MPSRRPAVDEPRTVHGRYVHTLSRLHTYPAFDVNDILQIEREMWRLARDAVAGLTPRDDLWDALAAIDRLLEDPS